VPPEFARGAQAETAAPPVATAAAPLTLEAVNGVWERIREAAKQQSATLGRAIERSRPKSVAGKRLVIEASVAGFVFSQLETPALKDPLETLLREALPGTSFEIAFERGGAASDSGPQPAARAAGAAPAPPTGTRSVYDEPIVKHAQRVLGSQSTAGGW
jgi:hypothetical protein